MNPKFLIIIICFFQIMLGRMAAQSQSPITIKIDFKNKKIDKLPSEDEINKAGCYQIQIENINQNLYKVEINTIDTSFGSALTFPSFGDLNIDALVKTVAGISLPATTGIIGFPVLQKAFGKMDFSPEQTSSDPILQEFSKQKSNFQLFFADIYQLKNQIDGLKFLIYKYQLLAKKIDNTQFKSLNFDFDTALNEVETIRISIQSLNNRIANANNAYNQFSAQNNDDISGNKDYKKINEELKNNYVSLIAKLNEALVSINAEKANELQSSIIFLDNNKSDTYTSFPFQFKGEEATVKVKISQLKAEYQLPVFNTEFTFPLKRRGYSGVGLSFYASGLYDEAWSSLGTRVDSTTNYSIIEEGYAKWEIGIAALLRVGKKWDGCDIGRHFSIGPAISISSKIKPRLLVGGGFSIGKKHLITLDGGAITGFVDRKSKVFESDGPFLEKPESITVSTLKVNCFVSLGYLFKF